MYASAACLAKGCSTLMQTGTCFNGSLQARHTVQNVIGGNVARQGLDGVLAKTCRAAEIDQHQVVAQTDQEGVARKV